MKLAQVLVFALCLTCPAVAWAQEKPVKKALFRWKWKKGQVFRYRISTKQSIRSKIEKDRDEAQIEVVTYVEQRVESVDNKGQAVLTVTYKRVVQNMKEGERTQRLDSDVLKKEAASPFNRMFFGLVDRPFTVVVSPRGAVLKVTGVDKIAEQIVEEFASNKEEAELMRTLLSRNYSNKQILHSVENWFHSIPEAPVALGQRWKKSTKFAGRERSSVKALEEEFHWVAVKEKKGQELAKLDLKFNLSFKNSALRAKDCHGYTIFNLTKGCFKKRYMEYVIENNEVIRRKTMTTLRMSPKESAEKIKEK